jgi:hypothetical protein
MDEASGSSGLRDEATPIVEVGSADPASPEEGSPESLARENAKLRAQVEELRARSTGGGGSRRHRVRRTLTVILVVLTSLSMVAATTAIWMKRTV